MEKLVIDKEKMAEKLKQFRGEKTQKEVCLDVGMDVGITPSALAMYETGERVPRDEIKVVLANYYHTTINELFFNLKVHEM